MAHVLWIYLQSAMLNSRNAPAWDGGPAAGMKGAEPLAGKATRAMDRTPTSDADAEHAVPTCL